MQESIKEKAANYQKFCYLKIAFGWYPPGRRPVPEQKEGSRERQRPEGRETKPEILNQVQTTVEGWYHSICDIKKNKYCILF